ncbi:MAG: tetratricopeptide repeat protein, partial [Gemmatimonadales bacterium]
EDAARYLELARALFPGFAAAGSPYWHLADAYRRTGDIRKAAAALEAMTGINGDDYRAFTAMAELSDSLGDGAAAARALEGALYAYPFDAAVHRRLAELATEQGDLQLAVRERRAIVALDPVDRAQALYDLALVQFRAGSVGDAKRSVLHALEIAPNFAAAPELLLEIYGKH